MNDEFEFKEDPAPAIKSGRGRKAVPAEPIVAVPSGEEKLNILEGGTPEFDELELEQLFDDLMFNGDYTEEIKIGRRMTVTFKTRSGKEARVVMGILDKAGYALGLTVESIRALYNLAQSTVVLNGTDISGENFDRKVELIEELPTQVISALMIALVKFDRKVEAAVRHGEENFS